jgi:RNA polymerase sigma-70 factor (ECF subfamily)
MRYFQPASDTRFYAGVDLHASSLFLVVLDYIGQTRYAGNLPAAPEPFSRAITPFQAGTIFVICRVDLRQYRMEEINPRRLRVMLDKMLPNPTTRPSRYGGSLLYDAWSDTQLLEFFVRWREEAVFAALVRRHGPMVLSVCRRVLRQAQDAEDAFQATFLVLAKKAHRLREPKLLANWLYGVAYRTALHARRRAADRSAREREAALMSEVESSPVSDAPELRRLLDEELNRLPEKYRAPLVLCYLEGKTNQEAARMLGWPSGSISHRLARGRELLRERLAPRLGMLTALLPAFPLTDFLEPASVPPLLAQTTAHAATVLVGAKVASIGASIISASVRDLMEETLESLMPSPWRWLYPAILLVLSLLGVGTAVYVATGGCPQPQGCHHAAPP